MESTIVNDYGMRISSLEANEKNIFQQLTEIKEDVKDIRKRIALKTDSIDKKVDGLDYRLSSVEKEPGEDFKYYKRLIVRCVITGLVGAILGAALTLIIK